MTDVNNLPSLEPLVEHVADWRTGAIEIDLENRLVRNVVLSGSESRNGYRYTADALQQAAALYARKPVFLDHATNAARPLERSTRDLVGAVVEARYEGGRIRGDIQILETEAGHTFLALVAADQPAVGMSHVVLAERGRDGAVIDRIHDVISIDAVVFPATTQRLRESHEMALLQEQLATSQAEMDRLRSALAAQESAAEVERLLSESGLPRDAWTTSLREQLLLAESRETRIRWIQDHVRLVRRLASVEVRSRSRHISAGDDVRQQFILAVKGDRHSVLG